MHGHEADAMSKSMSESDAKNLTETSQMLQKLGYIFTTENDKQNNYRTGQR